MAKFKTGDVVILNSDSPKSKPMTVEDYFEKSKYKNIQQAQINVPAEDKDKYVVCVWRTRGEIKTAFFHEDMLAKL